MGGHDEYLLAFKLGVYWLRLRRIGRLYGNPPVHYWRIDAEAETVRRAVPDEYWALAGEPEDEFAPIQ